MPPRRWFLRPEGPACECGTRSTRPHGFEEEPGPALGLGDPGPDQAGRGDVVVLITHRVGTAERPGELLAARGDRLDQAGLPRLDAARGFLRRHQGPRRLGTRGP